MITTPDMRRWGAHGWTAHEFRQMLVKVEATTVRLRCSDCGRVFILPTTHHAVDRGLCPPCYERVVAA